MNVIGQRLHSRRKFFGIGMDESLAVAFSLPRVINVDVFIPGVLHARGNHRVGGLSDQVLVHIPGEFVPTVPAHRRCRRKIVKFLAEGACTGKTDQ